VYKLIKLIKSIYRLALILLLLAIIIIPGCKKRLSENDALTLDRVRKTIMPFILAYPESHFQFPESFEAMLEEDLEPPINPYTGEPMVDTGSPEFDSETSPGNFHYAPVKDSKGQIVNFSVYVFGKKGLIRHIRPSPFAAR
jgi:hypothetical protein